MQTSTRSRFVGALQIAAFILFVVLFLLFCLYRRALFEIQLRRYLRDKNPAPHLLEFPTLQDDGKTISGFPNFRSQFVDISYGDMGRRLIAAGWIKVTGWPDQVDCTKLTGRAISFWHEHDQVIFFESDQDATFAKLAGIAR